jgi:hypothetical protein
MSSFQSLWDSMSASKLTSNIQEEVEDTHASAATNAIRNGMGISSDFWDNFLLLLNNSDSLAELLDVPVEKIGTWHNIIKDNLEKVAKADNKIIPKDRKKLLKTGLPEENE